MDHSVCATLVAKGYIYALGAGSAVLKHKTKAYSIQKKTSPFLQCISDTSQPTQIKLITV